MIRGNNDMKNTTIDNLLDMLTDNSDLINNYKTIYNVREKSQPEIKEILELHIKQMLEDNPGYSIHEARTVPNEDGSIIYVFRLKRKDKSIANKMN